MANEARCARCGQRYYMPDPDPWGHLCGLCTGATIEQKLLGHLLPDLVFGARKPPLRAGDERLRSLDVGDRIEEREPRRWAG